MWKSALAVLGLITLTACAGSGKSAGSHTIPDRVKVGKPYTISGITYYPEYDPSYDEVGVASWYGPGFHGKMTANGEIYNQNDITAAHPTLPMPSLVKVTNIANGKSITTRINDRGPFKDDRIIDLSRASAQALGISGLGRVRVQYLKEETDRHWAQLNLATENIQFAKDDPHAPGKGGLDGTLLAADPMPAQQGSAAPILSVSSSELNAPTPQPLLAPEAGASLEQAQSSWSLIGSAQAEELEIRELNNNELVVANSQESEPQAVQLFDKSGKSLNGGGNIRAAQPVQVSVEPTASRGNILQLPPSAHPSSMEPSAGNPRWFVQAGSFSSKANANNLAARLTKVATVDTHAVQVGGRLWHRVRLGPFTTYADADQARVLAENAGAKGAKLVKD